MAWIIQIRDSDELAPLSNPLVDTVNLPASRATGTHTLLLNVANPGC